MKPFKQLVEQAVMLDGDKMDEYVSMKKFPISVNAKSLSMAVKELWGIMTQSNGARDLDDLRLLFDWKRGNMYVWPAINGMHLSVMSYYGLNQYTTDDKIGMEADWKTKTLLVHEFDPPTWRPSIPKKHEKYITRFFKGMKISPKESGFLFV